MGSKKKHQKKDRPPKATQASRADKHVLYQRAVQSPGADVEFFSERFEEMRGRPALRLREDFCGTALLATTWCASDPRRTAVGVDLDGATLGWGREHNVDPAGAEVAARVELIEGDVRAVVAAPADITCAMNFSYCVFKRRDELRAYLEAARRGLREDGIFIAELYGGLEAIDVLEEERELDDFTYIWEQESFNPLDHSTTCHIHFEFDDGSRIERAFTYEWRLWTIPELRELLLEAGFREVKVFWEEVEVDEDEVDEDGDAIMTGTGEYVEVTELDENQESWLVYLIALA
ncbi:MAG: class I SAM-dependent methyltransferase [Myxococcales bacterium]|nr:class I SAM-dependent methyltransferase [Myxococcales bacterium]MCB9568605.1 class I SAM-dependent methyltransferase [Myxococcales bacterium]MCB9706017.1 class I SAM-dependent methyltransferase [Myxococcales bacterium]